MAPVVHALRKPPGVRPVVISTGQHREMLIPILEFFEIEVDHDLKIMTDDSLFSFAPFGIERCLFKEPARPSAFVNETNSVGSIRGSL